MTPRLASALLILLVAGCTVGPDYHARQPSLPAAYLGGPAPAAADPAPAAGLAEWWTVFHDPELADLIARAAGANLDVRFAAARVREARAARGATRADYFPLVDASGGAARSRLSRNSLTGEQLAAQQRPLDHNFFDGELDMTWELDVFGGTRRAVEAAAATVEAEVESGRAVLVTTLAEVGLDYLDLRGAQRRLAVARENLRAQREILALADDRFHAGLASELDPARAAVEVARTESEIPPLVDEEARARHALAVLLGRPPAEVDAELAAVGPIPAAAPRVPLGLPADLIRQRPDLRGAERELAAATAAVGVATSNLYPKFFLTGGAGLQSLDAGRFARGDSGFWSIGPGVRWPVFNSGRIRDQIRVQDARQEQAALRFEHAVLQALAEVENALTAFGQEQERHRALLAAETASARSFDLAQQRYRGGLVDFLDVLTAQRTLLGAQDASVRSDRDLGRNLIRLFKALGGGWPGPTPPALAVASPPPTPPSA